VSQTKALHYVFVASQNDVVNDPLILWFNGGPGCSSLLGFFQEHGPFVIDDGETYIHANPWPWNLNASVVYIESPAGVGYSYAGTEQDLETDDLIQSQDAYKALVQFFNKFPLM
jgi:carboxypeptidase C (cathepsin A)